MPLGVAFASAGPDRFAFVAAVLVVGAAGVALDRKFVQEPGFVFGRHEALVLVSSAWLAASLVGGLPWVLTYGPSWVVDGLFEGAAGFTTTGASILSSIEDKPRGLLFWRSMTQWLGGMGIIVLGIAILPKLSTGGVELLSAEAPGPIQEKLTPRIARTAKALWGIYLVLTGLQALALWAAGMTPYDAINHAFTTLSTGGFSTKNAGVMHFQSPGIEWIIIGFMFLAGANFAVYFHLLLRRTKILRDPELRAYLVIVLLAGFVITVDLARHGLGVLEAIRASLFQVVTVQTTTGFASADFDRWPALSKVVLALLFFVGACAGSTSGSIKVVRIQILLKKVVADLRRMVRPHEVIPIRQGDRVVPPDVVTGVTSFVIVFLLLFVLGGVALTALGLDPVSAFSASLACLANVGPGFGTVGPTGNFGHVPIVGKLLLTGLMIVGRLELFTVLVLVFLIPRREASRVVQAATRKAGLGSKPPIPPAPEPIAPEDAQPFASARYGRPSLSDEEFAALEAEGSDSTRSLPPDAPSDDVSDAAPRLPEDLPPPDVAPPEGDPPEEPAS